MKLYQNNIICNRKTKAVFSCDNAHYPGYKNAIELSEIS